MEKLKALLTEVDRVVVETFHLSGEQFEPMLFMQKQGQKLFRRLDWKNDDEKEFQLQLARFDMKASGIERYAIVCEAWMASPSPETMSLRPSQHESRREVLMLSACDATDSIVTWREILRNQTEKGQTRSLGPVESFNLSEDDDARWEGVMQSLLR